jgi:hypothetical protein
MESVTTRYGAGVKQSQTDQPDHRGSEERRLFYKRTSTSIGLYGCVVSLNRDFDGKYISDRPSGTESEPIRTATVYGITTDSDKFPSL